jgi:excisionase family DNA binding protein
METAQNPVAAPDPLGLLTDEEVAQDLLRCTPRMVRKLTETRQLESVKVGALVRYERAAVARYIASRRRTVA